MLLRAAAARAPAAFLASRSGSRLRNTSACWYPIRSPMQQQPPPQRHASSSSPAAASQPPGASVQHMDVNELQELLSNPILVRAAVRK